MFGLGLGNRGRDLWPLPLVRRMGRAATTRWAPVLVGDFPSVVFALVLVLVIGRGFHRSARRGVPIVAESLLPEVSQVQLEEIVNAILEVAAQAGHW